MQDTPSGNRLFNNLLSMAQAEKEEHQPRKNPLIWVTLIVIGLIIYIFVASDRSGVSQESLTIKQVPEISEPNVDESDIDRELLVPPGLRARELIKQYRTVGKPYPFAEIMAKASAFNTEGSLADAHLMFFFAAREGDVDAMIMMAEMSDPTLFRAENNLLDHPDAVQAYKWYSQALQKGFEPAAARLENLKHWAEAEANYGNAEAQHLLLNFN
jgi:TPR repeat protein